jgi:hypothetical protein
MCRPRRVVEVSLYRVSERLRFGGERAAPIRLSTLEDSHTSRVHNLITKIASADLRTRESTSQKKWATVFGGFW